MNSRVSLLVLALALAVSCARADFIDVAGKVLNVVERVVQGAKSLLQEVKANQSAEAASAASAGPPPPLLQPPPLQPPPLPQLPQLAVEAGSQAAAAATPSAQEAIQPAAAASPSAVAAAPAS